MNASTTPLIQRFLELCGFDPQLRFAIVGFEVTPYPDGLLGLIQVRSQPHTEQIWQFMPEITQILYRLGNFKAIGVQTKNKFIRHEMQDLLYTYPTAGNPDLPLPGQSSLRQAKRSDRFL